MIVRLSKRNDVIKIFEDFIKNKQHAWTNRLYYFNGNDMQKYVY